MGVNSNAIEIKSPIVTSLYVPSQSIPFLSGFGLKKSMWFSTEYFIYNELFSASILVNVY